MATLPAWIGSKARHSSACPAFGPDVALFAASESITPRMASRISLESRIIAAFVAMIAALVVVALLVVSAGRGYVGAEAQIDAWLDANGVLSNLSSTVDAVERDGARAMLTKRGQELLAEAPSKGRAASPS